jgi:hypothetical protein
MGELLDLLKSDGFRRHTAMFVGTYQFADVAQWLRGFEYALTRAFPDQPSEIDGFREWLVVRLEGSGNLDWAGVLSEKFGDGEQTTRKLFEHLDQFLADVATRGLSAILQEHKEYEVRRYGTAFTSRLAEHRRTRPSPARDDANTIRRA